MLNHKSFNLYESFSHSDTESKSSDNDFYDDRLERLDEAMRDYWDRKYNREHFD